MNIGRRILPLVCGLSLALLSGACNFNKQKVDTSNETAAPVSAADLNYANINSKVIEPYCLSCHSAAGGNRAGLNLETYASIMNRLELVQVTVIMERSMPPSGSPALDPSAYALMKAWLEAGAPQ